MKILSDANGKILGVGEVYGAVEYVGTLPSDFIDTFGLGKYTISAGAISPVTGWVMPVITAPI